MGIFPACFVAIPQVPHNHIFSIWHSYKLAARCSSLFQRRISLFASICALSCRRIGRESCWWYNSCPQVKPNLSLEVQWAYFEEAACQREGSVIALFPAKSKSFLPQNFQHWVKKVEGSVCFMEE